MLYYDENTKKIVSLEQLAARGLALAQNELLSVNIYPLEDEISSYDDKYHYIIYGECIKSEDGRVYKRKATATLKPVELVRQEVIKSLDVDSALKSYTLTEKEYNLNTCVSSIQTLFMSAIWARDFAGGTPITHRNNDDTWSVVPLDVISNVNKNLSKMCQASYEEKARLIAALNDCRTSEEVISLITTEDNN